MISSRLKSFREQRSSTSGAVTAVLLERLQNTKQVIPYGVEISEDGVCQCVEKGLYCYQGDIDEGLADYKDNSFDYVILNQTLQITKRPAYVLAGNDAHQQKRHRELSQLRILEDAGLQLLIKGTMPKNVLLPYEWYETPNIHLLTIRDFQKFCESNTIPRQKGISFLHVFQGRIMPDTGPSQYTGAVRIFRAGR